METITFECVEDYRTTDDQLILDCAVESVEDETLDLSGGNISLVFTFYSDDIVNLYFSPVTDPEAWESNLNLHYDAISSPVELGMEKTDNILRVSSSQIQISVNLDDATFSIDDDSRSLQLADDISNVRGESLVNPIGYTEKRVQEWPLKVTQTHIPFRLRPQERIYGCGERFGQVEHTGEQFTARVSQALGTGSQLTYKSIPFYYSTDGFGIFVETSHDVSYDFGATAVNATAITIDDEALSLTIFTGSSPKSILEKYTAFTGRPSQLPKWTFGLWQSKNTYESANEVEQVASKFRELSIPCDVIHIDPGWMSIDSGLSLQWDEDGFPEPETFLSTLHDLGFRISVWEYPYLKRDSELYTVAEDNGYLLTNHSGNQYLLRRASSDDLPYTQFGIIDFTDDDAQEWWKKHHKRLIDMGVDVFKLDFGEYVPEDSISESGKSGRAIHNIYPNLYSKTVTEAFNEAGRDAEPVLWTRPGWAGTQQYPIHWGGDPKSSFSAFAATVRAGLSLSMSGYPFWSCDVGGYSGEPSETLYIRWLQWALMGLSHVRLHGTSAREPWEFGEEAIDIAQKFTKERYRLIPYIYSYAQDAGKTGLPVMRPMILEYPEYTNDKASGTQHFLGEHILVAPVLSETGAVEVHLPEGEWINYWTGDRIEGPRTLRKTVELDELPVYVEAESLIPTREPTDSLDRTVPDSLEFVVYPVRENETAAEFDFYHSEHEKDYSLAVELSSSHTALDLWIDEPQILYDSTIRIKDSKTTVEKIRLNESEIEASVASDGDDLIIDITR